MQNLSARYNYIYNSKVILANHQTELVETYVDNYDQVLPLYLGPDVDIAQANVSLNLKPMEDIIKKAQAIILDKSYSNYIDDAYILLGKANFYNGNYFNAAEYFDYTAKTYRNNTNSFLEALNWKARSLMQLRRLKEANQTLDSLEYIIPDIKKQSNLADPFATLAQMCIYLNNDTAAISYLRDAIKASNQGQNKIRWTYILGQLYEKQKDYPNALISYRKVVKSNASFEMYFNANLSRIKIRSLQNGIKTDKQKELLALLKDDKNFDYNDQVYYQIAETHAADEDYQQAEKNYTLSIQKNTINQYQKGLSYLRIADLNFKQFRNYLKAKTYYDSTVNTLPKNYPGYDLILKKNQNLQYLTDRYEIISLEDTLQAIAKLPEASRAAKIQALVNPVEITTANPVITNFNSQLNYGAGTNNKLQPQNSFYFSNPTAISIGYSDFKRKWGNRKLENNWRQSVRTSAQETTQELANNTNGTPVNTENIVAVTKDKETLTKQYNENLPVNADLLNKSNQKIIDAYYEIASFYLQELDDPIEAQEVYQTLLNRFPANNHLAATYYSLFLINKNADPNKSATYKEKLLKEFSTSPYAKIILDPSFSIKQSELETVVNKQYNDIFELYTRKDFNTVIQQVSETTKSSPSNYLSPQFAYLKAIAVGRTNNVDSLLNAFNTITTQFPEDKLITPLVKDHTAYINEHLADFKKRTIALIDFDPNEPPFAAQQVVSNNQVTQNTLPKEQTPKAAIQPEPTVKKPTDTKTPEVAKPLPTAVKTDGLFTDAKSTAYYYVVHVADASLTLSSSRFGIGQFNRGNYGESNLRHQLKEFDNDQLIYVGNFSNFDDAKTYAAGITPQLKQIMKVPVNIYTGFIISKENFDKINSKSLLSRYMEFYKNNY
ncbi:tetratricopeptide repeat protein [Pedobacter frigoris]|uniref:type IX secretion system periplasmic lipoprotein PorW/SprE n=1 Tax=Pedobacter frigoris TaxID=2571272 RepID=UPI00292EF3FE|nr:tetratricopeptide repeat protein [Pedobacter frigoris]